MFESVLGDKRLSMRCHVLFTLGLFWWSGLVIQRFFSITLCFSLPLLLCWLWIPHVPVMALLPFFPNAVAQDLKICWFKAVVVVRSISLSLGPFSEPCLVVCRCANCFDCPCCMHTLSTRATSIPAPLPDDPAKTTMKKAYYLACGFCRWTSRDVGMADKSVGKGQSKTENWVTAQAQFVFWR